jgi:hypothetical protein
MCCAYNTDIQHTVCEVGRSVCRSVGLSVGCSYMLQMLYRLKNNYVYFFRLIFNDAATYYHRKHRVISFVT